MYPSPLPPSHPPPPSKQGLARQCPQTAPDWFGAEASSWIQHRGAPETETRSYHVSSLHVSCGANLSKDKKHFEALLFPKHNFPAILCTFSSLTIPSCYSYRSRCLSQKLRSLSSLASMASVEMLSSSILSDSQRANGKSNLQWTLHHSHTSQLTHWAQVQDHCNIKKPAQELLAGLSRGIRGY
jgi:hypothetical protein